MFVSMSGRIIFSDTSGGETVDLVIVMRSNEYEDVVRCNQQNQGGQINQEFLFGHASMSCICGS